MRDAVLFDLDNTLFDVEQYMRGAFADVARHLAAEHNVDCERVQEDLLLVWRKKTSMYSHLFDDIVEDYGIDADIEQIVAVFNDHEPTLSPYEGVPELLNRLSNTGYILGIITDGTARRQRRKLDALGLRSMFETVVLTAEVGEAKPSPLPFKQAARHLDRATDQCIYIGDNPQVDFQGPKDIGMATIRLRYGEFQERLTTSKVDKTVNDVSDLYEAIVHLSAD